MTTYDAIDRAPRLAIYGVGFVGQSLAKMAHERGWTVTAAYNRAGPKIGQDIGTLAGIGPLGVPVQDCDTANFAELDADVGIVSVRAPVAGEACFPAYERLLEAGVNVIALGSRLYNPGWYYPELLAQVDSLAKKNGVTFTGAGLWDMTRIWPGLIAAGASDHIDSIEYYTLIEPLAQGVHWAPLVGIGMTVDEFDATLGTEVANLGVYEGLGVIVLQYYGYSVAEVTMRQEPIIGDKPIHSTHLEKTLPPGMCVGVRLLIDVRSHEGVTVHSMFDFRVFEPDEVEYGTWTIKGVPRVEVRVQREDVEVASATSALNRVPDVLSAEAGFVSIMELGPLRPLPPARTAQ